jgi:tetratricopeptide (TPR) repeat protein
MEDGRMKKIWVVLVLVIFALMIGCTNFVLGPGMSEFSNGEYAKAIPSLKKTAESNPKDGWNFWRLGVAYCGNKQYQESVDAFKRYFDLPHDKQYEWTAWMHLADAYDGLGQTDLAISATKKRVELTPDSVYGFLKLSKLYKDKKQYDEALTAAKRAVELAPDNTTSHGYLGVAFGFKKQYNDAMKELTRAVEIDPKWSGIYGWMGHFSFENNAYKEAAAAYKKEVEIEPSPDGFQHLAAAYYRMGRYDDAISALNKEIETQTIPGGVGIMLDAKTGYPVVKGVVNKGPAKKADIQAGDTILEIDGKPTAGWKTENVVASLKGTAGTQVVLVIGRKDNKLQKTVTREKILLQEAASGLGMRSLIYRHKGDLNNAFGDAETASALGPRYHNVRLSLGAAYLDKGQYEESVKQLSPIKGDLATYQIMAVPYVVQIFCDARLLEATAYAKQGKAKEAAAIYFAVPEEDWSPKNIPQTEDRAALLQTFKPLVKEYRDRAASYESKGQNKEALAELSEALQIADDTESSAILDDLFSIVNRNPLLAEMPEDARKYAVRGEMLIKEGSFEQAVMEIKTAIRLAPYAAKLYFNTAIVDEELKKYPEAIRFMKIYLKAASDSPDARTAKDKIIEWEFNMEKGK